MADEEKPVADEQTTEVAEAAKSDTDETIEASDDSAAENSSAEEAIEAIAKNVQERASEIEDVLADVSAPTALPKAPSPALVSLRLWSTHRKKTSQISKSALGETRCEFPPLTR